MCNCNYKHIKWDSDFFGFKVAQILKTGVNESNLPLILKQLKTDNYRLIYWQIPNYDHDAVYIARKYGGFLADEKIVYHKKLDSLAKMDHTNVLYNATFYEYMEPETDLVKLALVSGEYSRYKSDPHFPKNLFEELYRCWITRSVHKEIAWETLIVRDCTKILGMLTLGENNQRGDIGLLAVAPECRRKGIGKLLVEKAGQYFVQNGYSAVQVVTQSRNTAARILYESCGYAAEKQTFFFHFWL